MFSTSNPSTRTKTTDGLFMAIEKLNDLFVGGGWRKRFVSQH
jgi:hypothetical protein